ncbi:MAG: hypothetical protein ACTHJR_04930 [Sphingomonas sp.]|uniref:hypothetical protein n=1 Tax=Sphingomonas sp. TaxID=28214 RepID=UPI003F808900
MAFDPESVDLTPIIAAIRAALKDAYVAGGKAKATEVLLALGGTIPAGEIEQRADATITKIRSPSGKAPRGTVPRVLDQMLTDRPGLTILEYEALAPEYDDRISIRSVGNELRRFEGTKYERDRPGGYQWFLKGQKDKGSDTPGKAASDPLFPTL